jgi:CDP-diacylglycerol--serine O-phosphatidyltransferase
VRRVRAAPTLLTLANLICGFGSITMSIHAITATAGTADPGLRHQQNDLFQALAVWLIGLAMVFDLLDGRVARLTGMTSRFGAELDSLADVVSFGLAPAVLAIVLLSAGDWPMPVQRAGWGMLALYVAAAAVRLARYNVEAVSAENGSVSSKGGEYFTGLPSPAAAGLAVSPVLLYQWIVDQGAGEAGTRQIFAIALPALMLGLAWLMISRVRYLHLGNWLSARRQKLIPVMLVIALLVLAAAYPHHVPVMATGGYVLGCLVWDLGRRLANARARRRLLKSGGAPGLPPGAPPGGP